MGPNRAGPRAPSAVAGNKGEPGSERTASFVRGSTRRCSAPGATRGSAAPHRGHPRVAEAACCCVGPRTAAAPKMGPVLGCGEAAPGSTGTCLLLRAQFQHSIPAVSRSARARSQQKELLWGCCHCSPCSRIPPEGCAWDRHRCTGTVCVHESVSPDITTALPTSPCLAPAAPRVPGCIVLHAHGCRCVTSLGTWPPKGPCAEPPCGLPVALQTPPAQHKR